MFGATVFDIDSMPSSQYSKPSSFKYEVKSSEGVAAHSRLHWGCHSSLFHYPPLYITFSPSSIVSRHHRNTVPEIQGCALSAHFTYARFEVIRTTIPDSTAMVTFLIVLSRRVPNRSPLRRSGMLPYSFTTHVAVLTGFRIVSVIALSPIPGNDPIAAHW